MKNDRQRSLPGLPRGSQNLKRHTSFAASLVHTKTGCWEWSGCRDSAGYGITTGGEQAHRVAYRMKTGHDAGKLCVLHRCDNPPCCNPAHLYEGTKGQNVRDAVERGRWRPFGREIGIRHPGTIGIDELLGMLEYLDEA